MITLETLSADLNKNRARQDEVCAILNALKGEERLLVRYIKDATPAPIPADKTEKPTS